MKPIKLILILAFVAMINCQAQDYATLNHWGKSMKLDRSFFETLNSHFSYFMNNTAPKSRYYDINDYNASYIKMVDNLKSTKFTIFVTEANQLQWQDPVILMPGTNGEQGRSKKSTARAQWLLYEVVLPSLQAFAKNK